MSNIFFDTSRFHTYFVLSVTPQSSVSLSSSRPDALVNGTPVNFSNVSSITQPNRTRSRRSSIRAMSSSRLSNSNISDVDTNTTTYVHYIRIVGLQTIDVNIVKLFYGTKNVPSSDATLRSLVQQLTSMLDSNNVLAKAFRMAKEHFLDSSQQPVSIRLLGSRRRDQRPYNLPTISKVVALIPSDGNPTDCRDVLIEERNGFHLNLPLNVPSSWKSSRKNVTLREYYAFRLHQRDIENPILHKDGRLFHTYIVDAYTTILDHDLDWYKRNQSTIRGPRYMIQQYHDAMAICRWARAPDLFVTMTCNPVGS
ncbi:uncharacterized protein Tco_1450928 [Tanacetum coccineum]